MELLKEIKRSAVISLWFVVLTFPIMIIRVNTIRNTVTWRFDRLLLIAIGGFVGSFVWNYIQARQRQSGSRASAADVPVTDVSAIDPVVDHAPIDETGRETWLDRLLARFKLTRDSFRERRFAVPATIALIGFAIAFPFINSLYQTNVMVSALIYVILALGLNIVIGLGGMLHLGYAAFYAVGAYTYGLLNYHFGVSFWVALPIGAGLSTIFGILLAIPVLRLRGDYLAIVTLGFGEIIRIVLMNWQELSMGPSGVRGIARPGFFGMQMNLAQTMRYTYFICLALVVLTIFIVHRLENSRIGRQWVAMGEDDVAARAMGVNTVNAKMAAFAIGAFWAGMAGVIFAARTTFINPGSFRVWESVLILSMVVLGGMGSIPGVIVGALVLVLMPEYLRAFSEYRLLIFGGLLVVMMVFRPGGIIPKRRKAYQLAPDEIPDGPPPGGLDAGAIDGSAGGAS